MDKRNGTNERRQGWRATAWRCRVGEWRLAALGLLLILTACARPTLPPLPPPEPRPEPLPTLTLAKDLTLPLAHHEVMARVVAHGLPTRLARLQAVLARSPESLDSAQVLAHAAQEAGYPAHRAGEDLHQAWVALDFALAYFHARREVDPARVHLEQRRKVLHLLLGEARAGYWAATDAPGLIRASALLQGDVERTLKILEADPAAGDLQSQLRLLALGRDLEAARRTLVQTTRDLAGAIGAEDGLLPRLLDSRQRLPQAPLWTLSAPEMLRWALQQRPELHLERAQARPP
ncbi:MAG: hypothetical protein HQL82_10405, partial [Magnetococcales bacterium]|nr:hypothetical protein [Magnetococcales bacterium]